MRVWALISTAVVMETAQKTAKNSEVLRWKTVFLRVSK
jgi:hypothetical protein